MTSAEPTGTPATPATRQPTSTCTEPNVAKADSDSPLSPTDFRVFNRLAEIMQYYHNHFRQTWNTLHTACASRQRPPNMSIRAFLSLGDSFVSQLTMHHDIEESYLFPHLGSRMPAFKDQEAMKGQHRSIHAGLDVFAEYLKQCRRGEKELRLEEMQRIMDSFGEVLWRHLDEEVALLQAENMRKYWTKEEMQNMPL